MNQNSNNMFPTMNQGFPGTPIYTSNGTPTPNQQLAPSLTTAERSFIENILRGNKGKQVDIYMTFTDSTEWRDQVFSGILEEAGPDHIIISQPSTGNWYLLQIIYLDYIKFSEPINYGPKPFIG